MSETSKDPTLLPMAEERASGKNFAAVPTGAAERSVETESCGVDLRDGHVVINTETHRRRLKNLQRDPRITALIKDEEDGYRYAEVRGGVTETSAGPEARAHADKLAHEVEARAMSERISVGVPVPIWR